MMNAEEIRARLEAQAPQVNIPPDMMPLRTDQNMPAPGKWRRVTSKVMEIVGPWPSDGCSWVIRREIAYWEAFKPQDSLCCYAACVDFLTHNQLQLP